MSNDKPCDDCDEPALCGQMGGCRFDPLEAAAATLDRISLGIEEPPPELRQFPYGLMKYTATWLRYRKRCSEQHIARAEAAALEAAARWHDQRAKDTPDAFEMEFHQASAKAIRALAQGE